jgi:hypothetical protein
MSLRLFHRPARRAHLFTDEGRQLLRDALDAAAGDRTLLRMALTNADPGGWERLARRAGGVIAVASLALVAWQAVEASSSARASADAVRATAWAAATQAVLTYDQTALQSDPNVISEATVSRAGTRPRAGGVVDDVIARIAGGGRRGITGPPRGCYAPA